MNKRLVNSCIIKGLNLPGKINRDQELYAYLLRNSVAYFFSTNLNIPKTITDHRIIHQGHKLKKRYLKTIRFLNHLSKESGIPYLLFKTVKRFPEVVDGDIDLFIKGKDFLRMIKLLCDLGFKCILEEPQKAICSKSGFCRLEPRVEACFHGLTVIDEKGVWRNQEKLDFAGLTLQTVKQEVDVSYQLLGLLYGPNYLKLYHFIQCKSVGIDNLLKLYSNPRVKNSLETVWNTLIVNEGSNEASYPIFLPDRIFLKLWVENILPELNINFVEKIRISAFFFYAKYSYLVLGRLHFQHHWYV
ncbi:MAG: hypothetical protein US96_C0002G0019 [Candidatus Woesebacteria bacterium GW2011_GWB1_38_5b]|uniref:Nucleotidyltransferase family protein n=1 Tax=Candidatus Woesebacteria bacterium GW2011_GWB1_38_5b TaxID=1618569 RepID=A0A0G0NFL4_9BACT|nr:MAG: hypothetical protein US96_C0002G0019 [Candidatus Woesebacteria bacterium GW2011_GWB1_38_5b]